MIVGITGTDGAGKGTVVDYLVEKKGLVHYSARAMFIDEIEHRGLENSRVNMRVVANELRAKNGRDQLVTYYLNKMKNDGVENAVIESLRAVAEVDTLEKAGGILLAVDANQHLRYERIQSRQSSSDQVSFEEFVAHEELEMNDPDPNGMQKAQVMEMADYTIVNEGTLEELHQQIDEVLKQIEHEGD